MKIKSLLLVIAVLSGVVLLVFIVWYILLIDAFTWRPPSTELELTKEEIAWKSAVETSCNFKIDYIGSDDSFMEDSIIYANVKVSEESFIQKIPYDSLAGIAEMLSISFHQNSSSRKEKTCIQFRFHHLHNTNVNESVSYSVDKIWLYHFNQKTITAFE